MEMIKILPGNICCNHILPMKNLRMKKRNY